MSIQSIVLAGSSLKRAGLIFALGMLLFACVVQQAQAQGIPVSAKLSLQSGFQPGANGKNHIPVNRDDPAAQRLDSSPAIYVDVTFADGSTGGHDYKRDFADNIVFDDTSDDPNDLIQVSYWDGPNGKYAAQLTSTGKGVGTATLKISFRNAPGVTASVPVSVVSDVAAPGGNAASPAIHMIIVGDTTEAELGVEVDLKRWCREFYEIKGKTGVTPNIVILSKAADALSERSDSIKAITGTAPLKFDNSVDAVLKECDDLTVKANDTVIFYFAGHGFRNDEVQGKWPAMLLYKNKSGRDRRAGLRLTEVFQKLSAKNPRLLLVIADCCNDWLPVEDSPPLGYETPQNRDRFYKKLYLESKGHYMASGSNEGQKSRSNKQVGGYFTDKFFAQLQTDTVYDDRRAENPVPSWDSIFTNVAALKLWENKRNPAEFQKSQWERIEPNSANN